MRILELGKFYPPHHGGIETLLRSWCVGFAQKGAHVDCVVANDNARSESKLIEGVHVHRCGSYGTLLSTSISPAYCLKACQLPSDLWHIHFPNPLADLTTLLGLGDRKLVISYHSDVIRQAHLMRLYGPLLHRVLRRADRIIVATPKHLEFSPWLAPHADRVSCIPFGIDLQRFDAANRDPTKISTLRALAKGRKVVLNVGRLVPYKGQCFLLDACRDLDVDLWLVGTGPLEAELKARAEALGLGNRVRFWGAVEDELLPSILHACDVFAFPSITPNEAFGLVQVEAMACGKPVICCDLKSGVPFVNLHQQTGLVVPPQDTQALRAALIQLLSNPTQAHSLGQAGRTRAHNEFSLQVMVDRYWDCFNSVFPARA